MDGQGKAKVALTFALYQGEQLIRRDTIAQDIVKVGKDPRSHLRVDDELASRMHAVIEVAAPTDITLIDLGNEPGTLVNGQRVNKCKIRPGDQVQIGSTLIVLEQAEVASAQAAPPAPSAPASVPAPAPTPSSPPPQVRPPTPGAAFGATPPQQSAKAVAPPPPSGSAPPPANPFAAPNPFASAANPFSAGAAVGANPFAQANPFAAPARDPAPVAAGLGLGIEMPLDPNATQGGFGYSMVKSGPDVNPDEVEVAHLAAIEVMVMWETNVLHVSHLTPPRSFYVGDEFQGNLGCDYFIPSETLGTTRAPVVVARGGAAAIVLLPRSHGTVDIPGQGKVTFADLIASGRARPSGELSGAHEFDLPPGAKARMELENSALAFQVTAGNAGRAAMMSMPMDLVVLLYYFLSAGLHVGLLVAVYFYYDGLLGGKGANLDDDANAANMNPYLNAMAEREREEEKPKEDSQTKDKEGGTGERHRGEEGQMGNPTSVATNKRFAVKGPVNNPDPHLARERALEEAKSYGALGLLASKPIGGDPNAPTAFDGRDDSSGNDELSARGNMFGATIGDAYGSGGLGLTGTGEGGGGSGGGVGMGDFGGIGHGRGRGKGQGLGNGSGVGGDGHKVLAPKLREGGASVSGQLPAAVIQRIVRQNFGRFRQCYLNGLSANPSLTGTVSVTFIIARSGAVSTAQNSGSSLPDSGVVGCVVGGFTGLSFPAPDNGTVTVTYPITFTPD